MDGSGRGVSAAMGVARLGESTIGEAARWGKPGSSTPRPELLARGGLEVDLVFQHAVAVGVGHQRRRGRSSSPPVEEKLVNHSGVQPPSRGLSPAMPAAKALHVTLIEEMDTRLAVLAISQGLLHWLDLVQHGGTGAGRTQPNASGGGHAIEPSQCWECKARG